MKRFLAETLALASIRVRLLARQRLGWLSFVAGAAALIVALALANASYLNPVKIFWDFALGASFVLAGALALLISTQLLHDERNRRTLHLVLSAGASRPGWIAGNALGICAVLACMCALWLVLALAGSKTVFGSWTPLGSADVLRAQVALVLELIMLVPLGILLSLLMRPFLALVSSLATWLFAHSLRDIERILTDPNIGRFTDDALSAKALWAARALPPFGWFDLRAFVGYEAAMPDGILWQLAGVATAWATLLLLAGSARFSRMDL